MESRSLNNGKLRDFFRFFQIFFLRIWLDWRALVELRDPNIEKQRNFFANKKIKKNKDLRKIVIFED